MPEAPGARRRRYGRLGGIRFRILSIVVIPLVFTAATLTVVFANRSVTAAAREAGVRALQAAHLLAANAQYALFSGEFSLLGQVATDERREGSLAFTAVLSREGQVLAQAGDVPPAAVLAQLRRRGRQTTRGMIYATELIRLPPPKPLADFGQGTATAPQTLGYAVVGIDTAPIAAYKTQTLLRAGGVMLIVLALAALVAWQLSTRLTRRIRSISRAVDRIAGGELMVRVPEGESGEIGVLAEGVNRMAEALQAHQAELEVRVAHATARLAAEKAAAEQANMAKSRFLASASHDLRQPLHALTLFVEALKARINYPEVRTLVEHIEASTAAMETLFNTLLDISRLDAGVIEVKPVHFAADHLAARIRQQFSALAAEKGLSLRIRPAPFHLYGDPLLLERILLNLVSNAIRYTEKGGIVVGWRRRGRQVRIEVWDSGQGIPEGKLQSIFQEFVQLGNPERDRAKGLGLGLAIVSRLGRLMGCRVEVRSRPGHGSVFSLLVPLGSAELIHETKAPTAEVGFPTGALVMLVDDEKAILRGMQELFDSWGVDLIAAQRPEDALATAHLAERVPDLILCDYRLPGARNGIEVVNFLRESLDNTIPAVILTGDTAPETIQALSTAGLTVLHKPVRPARLRALLMHLLNQNRRKAAA